MEKQVDQADWVPQYERWRHGGWYVTNVVYPNGAVGCVSNNYPDGRWRIVCEKTHTTFPSRDAAARAERVAAAMLTRELASNAEELATMIEALADGHRDLAGEHVGRALVANARQFARRIRSDQPA